MTSHLHRHMPIPCWPFPANRRGSRRKSTCKLLAIPLTGLAMGLAAVLALCSCSDSGSSSPPPPPIPVTDTQPVGDGLKVVGFAMLGAACVLVLGKLIRP